MTLTDRRRSTRASSVCRRSPGWTFSCRVPGRRPSHPRHRGGLGDGDWVNDDLQADIRHFGIKVEDVDAEIDRLRAAGVGVISPPADVLGGVRIAFFLDPDGARIEFVQGVLEYEHVYAEAEPTCTWRSPWNRCRTSWPVIGDLRHHDDPRGFLMTYFQAGAVVLEVFTFEVPTTGPIRSRPTPATCSASAAWGSTDGHDPGDRLDGRHRRPDRFRTRGAGPRR